MSETGKIREIRGSLAVVDVDKGPACISCTNVECKTKGRAITAENVLALPLKKGQKVQIGVSGAGLFRQSFSALLPPILGFMGGYLFTRIVFPAAGEKTAAFVGALLLFAVSVVFYRIKKRTSAAGGYVVIRIIR